MHRLKLAVPGVLALLPASTAALTVVAVAALATMNYGLVSHEVLVHVPPAHASIVGVRQYRRLPRCALFTPSAGAAAATTPTPAIIFCRDSRVHCCGSLASGLVSGSRELLQRTRWRRGPRSEVRLTSPMANLLAAGHRGWVLGARAAYFCSISPWRYSGQFEGGPEFRQGRQFGSQFGSRPSAVRTISTAQSL